MKGVIALLSAICLAQGGCAGLPSTMDIQQAVDQGGVVTFPAGNYTIRQTIVIRHSKTVIQGAGPQTVFIFQPNFPQVHCVNDRAFTTPCDVESRLRREITRPIAIGDYHFSSNTDVSDLRPGDWLIITEKDRTAGDVIKVDWAKVASTSGKTVEVQTPFRTSFSTDRSWDSASSGLGFWKVPQLVQGVEFRNIRIIVPDSGSDVPGISVFAAMNTRIDNVIVEDSDGQPLYSYLSSGLTIENSTGKGGRVLNEFAATVDVNLYGNVFSADEDTSLGFDFGTGFFQASGNTVPASLDIGMYLLNGVHDGSITQNSFAFVRSGGTYNSGNAIGMLARGLSNVNIVRNFLAGGAGARSMGISIGPAYDAEIPIPSAGNTIGPNDFGQLWGDDYDPTNLP
jgi:hypothetical protein